MLALAPLPRKTIFFIPSCFCMSTAPASAAQCSMGNLMRQFYRICSSQVTMVGIFACVQQVADLHKSVADTPQSPWALLSPPACQILHSNF